MCGQVGHLLAAAIPGYFSGGVQQYGVQRLLQRRPRSTEGRVPTHGRGNSEVKREGAAVWFGVLVPPVPGGRGGCAVSEVRRRGSAELDAMHWMCRQELILGTPRGPPVEGDRAGRPPDDRTWRLFVQPIGCAFSR